jgi:hypothetical protein
MMMSELENLDSAWEMTAEGRAHGEGKAAQQVSDRDQSERRATHSFHIRKLQEWRSFHPEHTCRHAGKVVRSQRAASMKGQ